MRATVHRRPSRRSSWLSRAALAVLLAAAALALVSTPVQAHDTCGQPSHAWVATVPNVGSVVVGGPPLTVDSAVNLVFAGVVHAGTPIRWGLYDPVTQKRWFYTGQPARNNCVVAQETDTVPAAAVGTGSYQVWAIYTKWESNPSHAEFSQLIGTLTIRQP
jgi:hypothetical protein